MLTEEKINKLKSKVKSADYAVKLLEALEVSFRQPVQFSSGRRDENAVKFAADLLERIE